LTCATFPVIIWGVDEVADKLDRIGKALEEIRDQMRKPKDKFSNTLETVVLIVAALGFLNIVDTVVRWFAGG